METSAYGVVVATLASMAAIGRFLWKWEKTFTDTAIDELKRLREENDTLRERLRLCEDERE